MTERERLRKAIRDLHGCDSTWLRSEPVHETFRGETVWDGVVEVFALLDQTLKRAGGTLANLVTMTVFIKEARHGDRFVELRRQKFPDGNYPASALITVTNFARPGMEIEIQGVAVIGDRA